MKRIEVIYDGANYSIGGRELSEVRDELDQILRSGQPGWLQVNYGEGKPQPAALLITAGCSISLMPSSDDSTPAS
jgi:hypothetical protein